MDLLTHPPRRRGFTETLSDHCDPYHSALKWGWRMNPETMELRGRTPSSGPFMPNNSRTPVVTVPFLQRKKIYIYPTALHPIQTSQEARLTISLHNLHR